MAAVLRLVLLAVLVSSALSLRPLEAEGLTPSAERPRKSAFATSIVPDPNYRELMCVQSWVVLELCFAWARGRPWQGFALSCLSRARSRAGSSLPCLPDSACQ